MQNSVDTVSRTLNGVMMNAWWQERLPPEQQRLIAPPLRAPHPDQAMMLMGLDPPFLPNSPSTHPAPLMPGEEHSMEWRECPLCEHRWYDKYRKDECPKCLQPLSQSMKFHARGGARREPGETSTFKYPPGSAMVSEYGECRLGGAHLWKYGQCVKCGIGEGTALARHYAALKGASVEVPGIPLRSQQQPQPFELAAPQLMRAVHAYESTQAMHTPPHASPHASPPSEQSRSPNKAGQSRSTPPTGSPGAPAFYSASFASFGADMGVSALHPRVAPPVVQGLYSIERQAVGDELLHPQCAALATSLPSGEEAPPVKPTPSPSPSHMGSREWERGLGRVQLRPSVSAGGRLSGRSRHAGTAATPSLTPTAGLPAAPSSTLTAAEVSTATAGSFMSGAGRPWRLAGTGPNSEQVRAAATLSDSELRLMQARVQAGGSFFTSRGLSAELAAAPPRTQRKSHDLGVRSDSVPSFARPKTSASKGGPRFEVRRICPTCGHRWLDKYRKDECPKCLCRISIHDTSAVWLESERISRPASASSARRRSPMRDPITKPHTPHSVHVPASGAAEMAAAMSRELELLKGEGRAEAARAEAEARARAEGRAEALLEIAQEVEVAKEKVAAEDASVQAAGSTVRSSVSGSVGGSGSVAAEGVAAESVACNSTADERDGRGGRTPSDLVRQAEQRATRLAAELAEVQAQLLEASKQAVAADGNATQADIAVAKEQEEASFGDESQTRQPAKLEAAPTANGNAPMSFTARRLVVAGEIDEALVKQTPHPRLPGWTYQQHVDDLLQRSASAGILELRRMQQRSWLANRSGGSGEGSAGSASLAQGGSRIGSPGKAQRKQCPSCDFRWLDKHGKDECPKCLVPLSMPEWRRHRRLPGEVSTYKQPPSSAMESASGVCPKGRGGQKHLWRLGRCALCGMAEGHKYSRSRLQGNGSYIAEVSDGGDVHWSVQMS